MSVMPMWIIIIAVIILLALFLIAVAAVVAVAVVLTRKKNKEKTQNVQASVMQEEISTPQNDLEYEYKTVEMVATVIGQNCAARMIGTKTPKTVREFVVSFQSEKGEVFNLNVKEEVYDGFEIGQKGLLTMVDNELYSFVPTE